MATFSTGMTVMTRGVADRIEEDTGFAAFVTNCFGRYLARDWGDVCEEDRISNDEAYNGEDRIVAAYERKGHPEDKIWIITEWDRSATTVLFPSEY